MSTVPEGAKRFMDALARAEEERRPEPLVEVFGDDAELWSVARPATKKGRDEIRAFWSEYLAAFERVRSEFTDVVAGDGRAALAWHADAVLDGGRPLRYDGVTLLELDGDRVARFRTYFDPRPFVT